MNTLKLIQTISVSSLFAVTAFASIPTSVKAVEKNTSNMGLKQNFGKSVIYVNARQGVDSTNAGSSLDRPLRSISYALQSAQPGTEIRLAEGEYSSETFPLKIPDGVKLTGNSGQKGSQIVIKGGGDYLTKTFGLQNVTIVPGDNTEISGVTVTNPNGRGTGVWVENTKPLISDSSFLNNNREGIFVTGNASPTITNSQFKNNTGNGIGFGRQAKGEIRRNLFDNTGFGLSMGGDTSPYVSENTIINNNSGIVLTENAKPILQRNIIKNNRDYGIIATSQANPQLEDGNDFASNGDDLYVALNKGSTPPPQTTIVTKPSTPPPPNTIVTKPFPDTTTNTATNSSTYSEKISFECAQVQSGYATVVQRDNPAVLPRRMINWTRQVGTDWSPERRCELVTEKLNRIVAQNGGEIDNLSFTTGRIEGSSIVCLANSSSLGCNQSNMLFTLSNQNARNTQEVIARLGDSFSSNGGATNSAVQESGSGNPYVSLAPLSEKLQPEDGLWFANY